MKGRDGVGQGVGLGWGRDGLIEVGWGMESHAAKQGEGCISRMGFNG